MYKAQFWFAIVAGIETSLASCKLSTSQSLPGNSSTTVPSVFPLLEDVGSADLFPMPLCGTFKLEEATIDEMQVALAAGTLTSQQLVGCYIQRTYQTQEYIQ